MLKNSHNVVRTDHAANSVTRSFQYIFFYVGPNRKNKSKIISSPLPAVFSQTGLNSSHKTALRTYA